MSQYHPGSLLVARPDLEDPNFRRTVIYLIEHNEDGAFGLILNRPSKLALEAHLELDPALASSPAVFFEGGPVDTDSVVALGSDGHGAPEPVDLEALLSGSAPAPAQLRFYAGYAGWSAGQLESELLSDSWFVLEPLRLPTRGDDLFGDEPEGLWRAVLGRQRNSLRTLAFYPDDVMAN